MPAYTYYTVMQQSQDKKYWRLLLVTYAMKHGIRAAARHFRAAPNTVRRWLRRWDGTAESLADRSRRPHHSPQKLSAEAEEEILAARRRVTGFPAKNEGTAGAAGFSRLSGIQGNLGLTGIVFSV